MPNTQPGTVRCAVLASMRQVRRVRHQRHRLARGGVGQAQEGHVGGVEQPCALGGVLALVGVDLQQLDVAPAGQHLVDAQAGRALLAVDEHGERHGCPFRATPRPLMMQCRKG
jgi:hypothetical protein